MLTPEYGEIIREARRKVGLSQLELAKSLGMSRTTISQIESGTISEIGVRKLSTLCFRLGLEMIIKPIEGLPTLQQAYEKKRLENKVAFAQTDAAIAKLF